MTVNGAAWVPSRLTEAGDTAQLVSRGCEPIQAQPSVAVPTNPLGAMRRLYVAACPAGALAQARKAALVTSDKDFRRVGTARKTLWV